MSEHAITNMVHDLGSREPTFGLIQCLADLYCGLRPSGAYVDNASNLSRILNIARQLLRWGDATTTLFRLQRNLRRGNMSNVAEDSVVLAMVTCDHLDMLHSNKVIKLAPQHVKYVSGTSAFFWLITIFMGLKKLAARLAKLRRINAKSAEDREAINNAKLDRFCLSLDILPALQWSFLPGQLGRDVPGGYNTANVLHAIACIINLRSQLKEAGKR